MVDPQEPMDLWILWHEKKHTNWTSNSVVPLGSLAGSSARRRNLPDSPDWRWNVMVGELSGLNRSWVEPQDDMLCTLWLCQHSYWKWPFIVDFPINSMVIFHSYGTVYQRVTLISLISIFFVSIYHGSINFDANLSVSIFGETWSRFWLAGWASKLPTKLPFYAASLILSAIVLLATNFQEQTQDLGWSENRLPPPKKSWLIRWSIIFPSFSHHFSLKNRPFYGHSYGSTPRNSAGIFLGPISDRQQLPSPDGPSGRGCWDWILEDPLVHQEVWLGAHLVEGLPGLPSGKLT